MESGFYGLLLHAAIIADLNGALQMGVLVELVLDIGINRKQESTGCK